MHLSRDRMHPYQASAVEFVKSRLSCALWLEMGLGKSVTALTAAVDLLNDFSVSKVLIIAPLRVARVTWPNEIEAWEHTSNLTYKVLCGASAHRSAAIHGSEDIHIINRELVSWLVKEWGKKWPYDMVIIDEASSFKSSSSQRFKDLKKQLPRISRVVELTGTPAANGLLDLWAQVYLLDKGDRLLRTFSGFRDRFFESDYMGYNWTPRPDSDKEIKGRLRDICLHLSAADYLTLPDRIDNVLRVAMPYVAAKQYEELERDLVLALNEAESVTAVNAAVLTGKLLQCANGALYHDDGNYTELHCEKLDTLESIVEEAAGETLLVAYNFRSDAERIKRRFNYAAHIKDAPDMVQKWNEGKVRMLLAHANSPGLNLQKGGHIIVWFGLPWSLEYYQQFNARLHRQGQVKPVMIHHILTDGTIDSEVHAALQRKDVTQAGILEAMKMKGAT